MVYVRGQRSDYDDWANAGNPGWAYDDVLPYFRKLETHAAGTTDPQHHGSTGPIHITSMKADVHPIVHEFLKGCGQLNLPRTDDFNGAQFEGAGIYDLNTKNGERCSSSFAYLRPALSRANLTLRSGVLVRRVTFDGMRATGVVVAGEHGDETLVAAREVILAAGASIRRSCCNCRAWAIRRCSRASACRSCMRCRPSAATCRTTCA